MMIGTAPALARKSLVPTGESPSRPPGSRSMTLFGLDGDKLTTDYTNRIIVTVLVAVTTSGATFIFTWWWAQRRAKRQWYAKEFLDRIIISLNIFADGYLKIRTVMERSLDEVFLNKLAVAKVWAAARATT